MKYLLSPPGWYRRRLHRRGVILRGRACCLCADGLARVGAGLRNYSAGGWGMATDFAYLHPLARTVHVEDIRATTRRSDHELWAGGRIYLAAKPGLLLETGNSLFFGVDVLLGISVINREIVRRRYQRDIWYTAFFNGIVFAPGLTIGVAH